MNAASPSGSVLDEVATWTGVSTETTPRGATAILITFRLKGSRRRGYRSAPNGAVRSRLPGGRRCRSPRGSEAAGGCCEAMVLLGRPADEILGAAVS
jgi:hypothetical protein